MSGLRARFWARSQASRRPGLPTVGQRARLTLPLTALLGVGLSAALVMASPTAAHAQPTAAAISDSPSRQHGSPPPPNFGTAFGGGDPVGPSARPAADAVATRLAKDVGLIMADAEAIVTELVEGLQTGYLRPAGQPVHPPTLEPPEHTELDEQVKRLLAGSPHLLELGYAFAPNDEHPARRLSAAAYRVSTPADRKLAHAAHPKRAQPAHGARAERAHPCRSCQCEPPGPDPKSAVDDPRDCSWASKADAVSQPLVKIALDEREDYVPESPGGTAPAPDSLEFIFSKYSQTLKVGTSTRPDTTDSGQWFPPAYTSDCERSLLRFVVPFISKFKANNGSRHGIVFATLDTAHLRDRFSEVDLGPAGYATLAVTSPASHAGHFVAHPDWDCLFQACTRPLDDSGVHAPTTAAQDETAQACKLHRLADTDLARSEVRGKGLQFKIDVVVDRRPPAEQSRRDRITAALLLLAFLVAGAALIVWLRRDRNAPAAAGTLSAPATSDLVSTLGAGLNFIPKKQRRPFQLFWMGCAGASLAIVLAAACYPNDPAADMTRIDRAGDLTRFWQRHQRAVMQHHGRLPVAIPTGVFVQSVSFEGARDVRLTGYIWQKYDKKLPATIRHGVLLPESESLELKQAYTEDLGSHTLIGWSFKVTLSQEFDYRRFPWGQENVWLQLGHRDFYGDVVLVPDLTSYKTTIPWKMPGVRTHLTVPGWSKSSSFFSYKRKNYKTSFGPRSFDGVTSFPELYFNIIIEPEILGPAISHLLPTLFILVMLYAMLLLSTPDSNQAQTHGFDAMTTIAGCAGFFLVVIFSHQALRDQLASTNLTFFEWLYFVTYGSIVYVALNSLALTLTDWHWVHHRNNAIPKLLYWPLVFGLVLVTAFGVYH